MSYEGQLLVLSYYSCGCLRQSCFLASKRPPGNPGLCVTSRVYAYMCLCVCVCVCASTDGCEGDWGQLPHMSVLGVCGDGGVLWFVYRSPWLVIVRERERRETCCSWRVSWHFVMTFSLRTCDQHTISHTRQYTHTHTHTHTHAHTQPRHAHRRTCQCYLVRLLSGLPVWPFRGQIWQIWPFF